MHENHDRSFAVASQSARFMRVGCAAFFLLLTSCSAGLPVVQPVQPGGGAVPDVRYSIVAVIHGDGDYNYHDTSGIEHAADEEAVANIKRIAGDNPLAEVFVFHQRVRRHTFLFFPVADGEYFYYRSGQLFAHDVYWRNDGKARFETEAGVYHRYHVLTPGDTASLFLYYGHEIPEFGGQGYDASDPNRTFTVTTLAAGLHMFRADSQKFDLMVLSTCYGGTPYTIGALAPFARTIIASPDNLHLSYFDYDMLAGLDQHLRDGDVPAYAKLFASHSFDKLSRRVQTAVSVAVYDADSVKHYVEAIHQAYSVALTGMESLPLSFTETAGHGDCGDVPVYTLPGMSSGVIVYYRPPLFGRMKNKQNHSGWECWKMIGQPPAVLNPELSGK